MRLLMMAPLHGQQLGVVQSVLLGLSGVMGQGDGLAVLGHHRSHRHLAQSGGFFGFLQGQAHQFFVGHWVSPL